MDVFFMGLKSGRPYRALIGACGTLCTDISFRQGRADAFGVATHMDLAIWQGDIATFEFYLSWQGKVG